MNDPALTPEQLHLLLQADGSGPVVGDARAFREIGDEVRAACTVPVDLADEVMLSIALQAAVAGEVDVADDVMLSIALQAAVSGEVNVADDVMLSIALQGAVGGEVDVADDVMDDIERPGGEVVELRPMPARRSAGSSPGTVAVLFAMAAAVLFAIRNTPPAYSPVVLQASVATEMLQVSAFNEAEVVDLNAGGNATVSVMQFDEGGPTVIFVQDSEG